MGDPMPVRTFVFDELAAPRDGYTRGRWPEARWSICFGFIVAPTDGLTRGRCSEAFQHLFSTYLLHEGWYSTGQVQRG